MGNPVVHWEIGSRDGARLRKFYGALFDWRADTDNPMDYAVMTTGWKDKGGIDGGIYTAPEGVPPYLTVYVGVDDPEAYLVKAEALGATRVMPPKPIEGVGTVALFKDPEGHLIGLFHPAPEPMGRKA